MCPRKDLEDCAVLRIERCFHFKKQIKLRTYGFVDGRAR
jgi:hypothetical protein